MLSNFIKCPISSVFNANVILVNTWAVDSYDALIISYISIFAIYADQSEQHRFDTKMIPIINNYVLVVSVNYASAVSNSTTHFFYH